MEGWVAIRSASMGWPGFRRQPCNQRVTIQCGRAQVPPWHDTPEARSAPATAHRRGTRLRTKACGRVHQASALDKYNVVEVVDSEHLVYIVVFKHLLFEGDSKSVTNEDPWQMNGMPLWFVATDSLTFTTKKLLCAPPRVNRAAHCWPRLGIAALTCSLLAAVHLSTHLVVVFVDSCGLFCAGRGVLVFFSGHAERALAADARQ